MQKWSWTVKESFSLAADTVLILVSRELWRVIAVEEVFLLISVYSFEQAPAAHMGSLAISFLQSR